MRYDKAASDLISLIENEQAKRPHLGEFLTAWGIRAQLGRWISLMLKNILKNTFPLPNVLSLPKTPSASVVGLHPAVAIGT